MLEPRGIQYCDLVEGGRKWPGGVCWVWPGAEKETSLQRCATKHYHGFDVPKLPINHEGLRVCLPSPGEGQLEHLLSRETVLGMGTPTP